MKGTNVLLTALLVSALLFCSNSLSQELELELNTSPKIQIEYEPFSGLPASSTLNVNATSLNAEEPEAPFSQQSRLRLRITPSQGTFVATSEKGDTLPLIFTSQQNSSRIQRLGNQYLEDINLDLNQSQRSNFDYSVSVSESQFAKPGIYRLLLDVDIVTLNTNEIISNDEIVEVEVLVKPKLQANIAGSRSARKSNFATIDFGKLESNESGSVFLQVQGNTDAEIILSSENNGHLINQKERNELINYSIEFDGKPSKLTSPLNVTRPVAKTLRGSSYPLKVIIGDVEGSYSGQYRDIITIDVNPQ